MSVRPRVHPPRSPLFLLMLLAGLALQACSTSPNGIGLPIGGENAEDAAPGITAAPTTLRELRAGTVVGFESPETSAHVWRGIPYAEAPVGELRWRRARALPHWEGTREALRFGSACVQFASPLGGVTGEEGTIVGDEDCLFLDVYAPPMAADAVPQGSERLPVMLWIHGGGNNTGAGHLYDGGALAVEHGVIVVAVNYRLGPFGWLRHPAITSEAADAVEASGNFGTLDLVRSLEWVRDNIGAFGGDPWNVTIFGESAGGLNVLTLMLAPQANGLFHRAISQSGGPWTNTVAQAENWQSADEAGDPFSSREVLGKIAFEKGWASNLPTARAMTAAWPAADTRRLLRGLPAAELLEYYRDPEDESGAVDMPRVFRDGTVLPKVPMRKAFEAGRFHRVPIILGTNRDEQKIFMAFDEDYVRWWFGAVPRLRDPERYARDSQYSSDLWKATGADEIALAIAEHDAAVWVYRFDWDEAPTVLGIDLGELVGAAHGFEIDFAMPGVQIPGVKSLLYTEENEPGRMALTRQMTSYWSHFAFEGDPGRGRDGTLQKWERFDERDPGGLPSFVVFDTPEGGGVRMAHGITTTASVVERALSDPRFESEERCERLDSLERNENPAFQEEWRTQAGC